jgi:hypothetical protein
VLNTAIGPLGVTEFQYALFFVLLGHALQAVVGGDLMAIVAPIPAVVLDGMRSCDILDILPKDAFQLRHLFAILFIGLCIGIMVYSIGTTLIMIASAPTAHARTSLRVAVMQLFPVASVAVAILNWPEHLLAQHFRLISLGSCLLMFHLTSKMIVFSMAKQTYPAFQVITRAILLTLMHKPRRLSLPSSPD